MKPGRDEMNSTSSSAIKKSGYSVIEKINDYVVCSTISISEFVRNHMNSIVPSDYRTARGIELAECKPALEYCTEKEIERVAKAKSLKRQVEWLCGRIVLKDLLCTEVFPGTEHKSIVIDYEPSGRPFIPEHPGTEISVTHSGDFAVAAFNIFSGKRIGIDLEKKTGTDIGSILPVAFSPEERDYYKNHPAGKIIEAFSMKEAYLKVTGEGFHQTITRVSIKEGRLYFDGVLIENLGIIKRSYRDEYILSIIYEL